MPVTNAERRARALPARLLAAVTEVRPGEAPLALVLALNVLLLLTAYYVIKPVREALVLALDSGAEYKSWMSAVIAVALVGLVPAYARLVDRLPRLRLVVGVTLFFASHLALFFAASQFETLRKSLGLVFYVWVGVFNMMVVAQLWAFAADLYDAETGKRLLPLVALGASLGAALGSKIAAWLVEPLGVPALLLVAAALLVVCAGLFVVADRLARARTQRTRPTAEHPSGVAHSHARQGAFALVVRHRYLLAVALFTLAFSWVNSNGEYLFGRLVKAAATEAVANGSLAQSQMGVAIGKTYADFFFAVNVLGVVLQAFVVSRVVRFGGLGLALGVLPVLSLFSAMAVLVVPVLGVVRAAKTLENATDYSLNNTARQLVWLPTTAEMKFKAKQAIDTFFVRAGDVSSALLVAAGTSLLDWSVRGFALANAVLAVFGLVFAVAVVREGRRLSRDPAAARRDAATSNANRSVASAPEPSAA
jgi:AAA family ATP:ADP antiporter